jgi:hypothetical protein
MGGAISVLSIGLGAALAHVSARLPARPELLETVSGILLIGGFAAIGCALPSL